MRLPPLAAAVDRALRAAGTPARGETLLLALSGGADSVALLDALALLRGPRGFRLVAAHLDHRLRPDSAEDAGFCQRLCASLAVPLRLGSAEVRPRAAAEGGGLEQAARRARYAFLRTVSRQEQAAAVAVAHTRDDQAETLLLRLLRGAGSRGLGGMRLRRGTVLRPLLEVSRAEVIAYLQGRGLAWREDPTNRDPAHRRNRVRHELLPYLEARFNPRLRESLARTAALLADDAAYLGAQAEALLARIGREEEGGFVLRRAGLAQAPAALAREAIRRGLRRVGGLRGVAAVHVERVRLLARGPAAGERRLPLPGGRQALVTASEVRLERRSAGSAAAVSSAAR